MKTWETPKLIILVRGQQTERGLSFCKSWDGAGGESPVVMHTSCDIPQCVAECEGLSDS
jgi:hypothetical protein